MKQTPEEELIDSIRRYKAGEMSRIVFEKQCEFIKNWITFKLSNLTGFELISEFLGFASAVNTFKVILAQPKPSKDKRILYTEYGKEIILPNLKIKL